MSKQTKVEKNKGVAKNDVKKRAKLKFMKREVPEKEVLRMKKPPK